MPARDLQAWQATACDRLRRSDRIASRTDDCRHTGAARNETLECVTTTGDMLHRVRRPYSWLAGFETTL
jgi:hypothetical protein